MSRRLFLLPLLTLGLFPFASCSSGNESDPAGGTGGQGGSGIPTPPHDEDGGGIDLPEDPIVSIELERLFPTEENAGQIFTDCTTSSPLVFMGDDGPEILVATNDRVVALHPETGSELYSVTLPALRDERPFVVSTPVLVGQKLVVAYHTTVEASESKNPGRDLMDRRVSQMVAVVDLAARDIDEDFPPVVLSAVKPSADEGHVVPFRADKSLQRGKLVHVPGEADSLGRVLVTFGNARDLQPWHGWAFTLSLDAWKTDGADAAVTNVLLVTPEHDCGPEDKSGSRARICGGGLWAPTGPLLVDRPDGKVDVILAPGNGQLDFSRGDYANTLLRTDPELHFTPGCNETACADFDPDHPSRACVESCENVFVPRIPEGEPPLSPESGVCEGVDSMFACWEKLDYVGGSTPAYVEAEGKRLLAYPTKDGHVYLVDADHLGTLYQRKELVKVCGTKDDECRADWAGMIVAQPSVTEVDDGPLLVVPTFMPDSTHTAGVFALSVEVEGDTPRLETRWVFPDPESPEAKTRFRMHPSQATIAQVTETGHRAVFLVEPAFGEMERGKLIALRLEDGHLLADVDMAGRGRRFIEPLVYDGVVYTVSCESDRGRSFLEAHRFVATTESAE